MTCSTSETLWLFIVQLFELFFNYKWLNSIWNKKIVFRKIRNFEKNSKSQVTWHHNGQKIFFRFFGLRMTQFEKINEKKNSKIFIFFEKILSLRSRDLAMGIFGSKFFYCIFGIRMLQFVKKKQKIFFRIFWP